MSATENFVKSGAVGYFDADPANSGSADAVEGGDMVKVDPGTGLVSIVTADADSEFFCGVSDTNQDQKKVGGVYDIEKVTVMLEGVFRFAIASGQYYRGQLVKIVGRKEVVVCTTNENSIGTIWENTAASATEVLVKIKDGIDSSVNLVR